MNAALEEKIVWTKRGNQGNVWLKGQVSLESETQFNIIFEAVRETNNLVSICIRSLIFKLFSFLNSSLNFNIKIHLNSDKPLS